MSTYDHQYRNRPTRSRDDSDHELDVFEATAYLSTGSSDHTGGYRKKALRSKDRSSTARDSAQRRSLDVVTNEYRLKLEDQRKLGDRHDQNHSQMDGVFVKIDKTNKKLKQPVSPGGRLARFISSIFHQGASNKKKPQPVNSTVPKSLYSCKSTGFRAPPAYPDTPKSSKPHSDLTSGRVVACCRKAMHDERVRYRTGWRWDKSADGFSEKGRRNHDVRVKEILENDEFDCNDGSTGSKLMLNKNEVNGSYNTTTRKLSFWRREEIEDDGEESDSSSDLFELPNCHLGDLTRGLPVYETNQCGENQQGSWKSACL